MKAFTGFKTEAISSKPKQLPAGPYVAKVLAVKIEGDEPDQKLVIRMDVIEGEYKNYFRERYERESKKFDAKYKGDYTIRIPNDNNKKALYPETDVRNFNDMAYRFAQSNPGYRVEFDENGKWDEQSLVGLIVGINMQDREWNGAAYTAIGRLETADDVRKGIVKPMPPRKPKDSVDAHSGMTVVQQEELPWNDKPSVNPYF